MRMQDSIALLIVATSTFCSAADNELISPTIRFSPDEQTVYLKYSKGEWNFRRPVVAPWKYQAKGKTIWVAETGDDSADGSTDKPMKTISHAVGLADAGDLIYVRAGAYVDSVEFKKSGEADRPIILSCAPDALGKVKITSSSEYVSKNPHGAVIVLHGSHYVWINGLIIEGPRGRPGAPTMETYGANGISFAAKAGIGCRATNNVIYHNVHCGIKEMGHGGTGILVEANLIFDNGTESRDHGIYCPADGMILNGNILLDNAGYGIHSYSHPKGQQITRNLCINNKICGIILAGSDCKVFHNVCIGNGRGIFYFRGGCTNNIVQNNIFAFNQHDCDYDNGGGRYGDPAGNADDCNCYFPGKPRSEIHAGMHEVLLDPKFADSENGDFRLMDTSPCRAAGKSESGQMIDLGAF